MYFKNFVLKHFYATFGSRVSDSEGQLLQELF